jgi:hypothetical protein
LMPLFETFCVACCLKQCQMDSAVLHES